MYEKVKDFFFNRLAGKLIARAAVTIAGFLASGTLGASVHINPDELSALMIAGSHAVYEWVKHKTNKKPEEKKDA